MSKEGEVKFNGKCWVEYRQGKWVRVEVRLKAPYEFEVEFHD